MLFVGGGFQAPYFRGGRSWLLADALVKTFEGAQSNTGAHTSYLSLSIGVPVASGRAIRVCGHISQEKCPWNVPFSHELTEPAFQPRNFLASKDARTLARELLAINQEEFSAAFRNSPMKRAKRRGLARNAAVVLGNIGNDQDMPVLMRAVTHDGPLVREHAAWALAQLTSRGEWAHG